MKTYADLQIHTTYSDGEENPLVLLEKAKKIKLRALSFTDHHYLLPTGLIKKIKEQEKSAGIKFIEATEISCSFEDINFHLLVYSKKFKRTIELKRILSSMCKAYDSVGIKILKVINKGGFKITKKDFVGKFYTYLNKNLIYATCAKKFNISIDVLRQMKFPDVTTMVPFEKLPNIIRKANGLSVLAHPGSFYKKLSPEQFENFLEKLVQLGLDGIEFYHYKNTDPKMLQIIKKMVKKHDLALTGGSDFHGEKFSGAKVGQYGLTKKEFEDFYNKLP